MNRNICRVLKAWHLYTHALQGGMGKGRKNKVLKLTAAKVKYIIRAKTNNISSRNISSRIITAEMKTSIRTVNRVWEHWMKNKEPLAPKEFGPSKMHLNEADTRLIFVLAGKKDSGWILAERKIRIFLAGQSGRVHTRCFLKSLIAAFRSM